MEKIYSLVDCQKYQEAVDELVSLLEIELPNPNLETIELLNGILSLSQKMQDLQIVILKLAQFEKSERYCNIRLNLARLYIDLGAKDVAQEILVELQQIDNPSLQFIAHKMSNMLNCEVKEVSKEEQWETFKSLTDQEQEVQYFDCDGLPGFLIPTQWLNKFRSFVSGEDQDVPEDLIEGLNVQRLRQVLNQRDDTINEEGATHPGPIDGSRLVSLKWNLILDSAYQKQYLNCILRENLQEGRDFTLVGLKVYKYLESIYGGFPVKRLIVSEQEKKIVDLIPRIVNFIFLENFEKFSLSANGFDQILELTKKVRSYKGTANDIQWWKFNNIQAQQDWFGMVEKGTLIKNIKAKKLHDREKIENLNITPEDIFICEIKSGKSWQIEEDTQVTKVSDSQVSDLFNKFSITSVPRIMNDSRRGMTGLQNLGNTCFMNAALQCLSNTYEYTEYMVTNKFAGDLNPNNVLGAKGYLATSYAELMKSMWFGNNSSVSAIDLKRVIGKFAPQFYGYGQQDSHEFLSYLLDGLHEDLNRILNKPKVTDIEITNESDQQASDKFWINYTLRNSSKIQELMVGQYKSTLVCPLCKRISKTFDPFMSLSLPIPNFQPVSIQLYFIYEDTDTIPAKILLQLSSDQSALDIIRQLENLLSIDHRKLNMLLVKEHQIRERVTYEKNTKWVHEHDGILFVVEVAANQQNLSNNQVTIDFFYLQKGQRIYEDKILSFPRQVVVEKQCTPQQLYGYIYQKFRVHLVIAAKELSEKEFPIKNEFIALPKPKSLEENINEFNVLQQKSLQPFRLRIKDRQNKQYSYIDLDFASSQPLDFLSQNIQVEVVISDYLTKTTSFLKLQRCKEFNINDQKSSSQQTKKGDYDLEDCLRAFTKEEILGKNDEWYCNKCKKHVQASKKMEIYKAPKILIVHLKRFKTNKINNYGSYYFSGGTSKITSMVNFPHELNLNNFVLSKQGGDNQNYTYDLFGVDNHYGGLGGGHYTAYAYNSVLNKWIEYNDSNARQTSSNVVSEAAYVLFYRRRDADKCVLFK